MLEGMVRKQTEKQAQTLDSWLDRLHPLTGNAALAGSRSSHAML
mgnify:CR=1 FL=1